MLLGGSANAKVAAKGADSRASGDVESGDVDKKPLLPKGALLQEESSSSTRETNLLQEMIGRVFFSRSNPKFADDAELAVRAAFFVVVVGLPFLVPEDNVRSLDYVMSKGMYTNGVVIFFIYNLYKTTGETIMNVVAGMRGTVLAVCNMWAMYYFFPDGVTETSHSRVWWAGVINGVVFIMLLLALNWMMSTKIFAISTFVGFWMNFLKPGPTNFQAPFTEDFDPAGNIGVNSFITIAVGGFLCIMVTFVPYPRWALHNARSSAKELVHELPLLWKTMAEYFDAESVNTYQGDSIHRRLNHLSKEATTLEANINNSWYECFGSGERHQLRRILAALEGMIHESYDRIHSTYTASIATEWSELHKELMQSVRPSLFELIQEVEVLLHVCFQGAFDGQLSDVEVMAMKKMMSSVRASELVFAKAFTDSRNTLVTREQRYLGTAIAEQECMEKLQSEHMFALNISSFVRSVVTFADDLCKSAVDPEHFPQVTELETISSLWKPSVVCEALHVNWVVRASLSIFTAFAIGYNGFKDIFQPYNAGIACTTSVLLSSFVGSAMVKNLNRVQGVVLGTVSGQMVHSVFESCGASSITALTASCFGFATLTLFTYYNSTQFSSLGQLLGAFGCGQMLTGGCGRHTLNKEGSYDDVSTTVCSIAVLVVFDLLFAPGRASQFAYDRMREAMDILEKATSMHLDRTVPHVRFHKGELQGAIAAAEAMGLEAFNEPRYWRTEWNDKVYTNVVRTAYRMRYTLAAMEYSMTEDFLDGGLKNKVMMQLLEAPSFSRYIGLMQDKLTTVKPLVGFIVHETVHPFAALSDVKATHEFRAEVRDSRHAVVAEIAKSPMLSAPNTQGTLEYDALCQVCSVLGSLSCMMDGLSEYQHCILRGD